MAAAVEALFVSLATDDERARSHAARNNSQLTQTGAHRSLAGYQQVPVSIAFPSDVVVVAVDRFEARLERGDSLGLSQRSQRGIHHHLAVSGGESLSPFHRLDVL